MSNFMNDVHLETEVFGSLYRGFEGNGLALWCNVFHLQLIWFVYHHKLTNRPFKDTWHDVESAEFKTLWCKF